MAGGTSALTIRPLPGSGLWPGATTADKIGGAVSHQNAPKRSGTDQNDGKDNSSRFTDLSRRHQQPIRQQNPRLGDEVTTYLDAAQEKERP